VFKRTPLDIFFALFLLTAAVGVWAAYDRQAAWEKFWLLAGAVAIYFFLAAQPSSRLPVIAHVLGGFGLLLSTYFLFTHDWQARPVRIGFINQVGVQWMALRPPLGTSTLDPDVIGGIVGMMLPFVIASALRLRREGRKAWMAAIVVLSLPALFGLLLTAQRGAWLGLALAFGLWLLWAVTRRLPRSNLLFWSAVAVLTMAAISFAAVAPALALKIIGPGNRLEVASYSLWLASDFIFSGGGLGSFPGLFSRYILVIPWLFMPHSSNLFLDTLVEQGVLGLMALAGIFLGSFWLLATRPQNYWSWATAGGLIVMTVYGLVEDPFYSGWPVLLLFVFPGLGVVASEPGPPVSLRPSFKIAVVVGGLAVLAGLFVAFRQQVLAAWYANLGAVEMARVELAGWPETARWQSDFDAAEFLPAVALLNRALQFAPNNVTANYRLGLVAAKQGYETEAVSRWSQANQAAPSHRGVRKVLGYAYVWQGQLDLAAELLSDIPEAKSELDTYSWWWGTQGRDDLAAQAAAMVERLP
jgi:hypothetical protein